MLKKLIKYEDFDGNIVEETLHFNLTKAELMELEATALNDKPLSSTIPEIVESPAKTFVIFKKIILMSYGVRVSSNYFEKSPEITKKFESSMAFSALMTELSESEEAVSAFMNGILPKNN